VADEPTRDLGSTGQGTPGNDLAPTQGLPEVRSAEFAAGRATPTAGQPARTEDEDRDPPRPSRSSGRFLKRTFWTLLILALVGAIVVGVNAAGFLPEWRNPFAKEQTVKNNPPLLLSIRDLSRFVAAEGNFEVVIDLKEDRKFIPDWLLNQRTLFVGAGTVEVYVDFSQLTDASIIDSADHKTVQIYLPPPQLAEPALDLDRSYVFAEDRGLINRVGDFFEGDPNRQTETMKVASEKIATAAANSGLKVRAEENTRKTLEGILHSLGYTSVTVTFGPVPAPVTATATAG
jgi:hypothetical protein